MNRFYIWTIGCQMNKADARKQANELIKLGYKQTQSADEADIIVLNSCVVRQSAEDKVVNKLSNLKSIKRKHPEVTIALTGCMVEPQPEEMKTRFPHVDYFLHPQGFDKLISQTSEIAVKTSEPTASGSAQTPTAFVPIITGCNNFCSYCIVPYRRGREKSRPIANIISEVQGLVETGLREVTLLGQNVDSYGCDLSDKPDLADLLSELNQIDNLARIRFLTSHPKDMSQKLINSIASLEKVCEHISLPVQAGDDEILTAMKRGYTVEQFRDLLDRIRATIPEVALSTDVILGFPGETADQFQRTFDLLQEYRFETVHSAAYSPRPGTYAWRALEDNVSPDEKKRRLNLVEELQEEISTKKNAELTGKTVEVLVECKKGAKWQGRTRTDKLVFFQDDENDWTGQLVDIKVERANPWSLQGKLELMEISNYGS